MRLQAEIGSVLKEYEARALSSVDSLVNELRQCSRHAALILLLIEKRSDLQTLLGVRNVLVAANVSTILILPDQEKETISRGHKLYPRFLTSVEGNFSEIAAVLAKIIANRTSRRSMSRSL
jgi:hypothetical protein